MSNIYLIELWICKIGLLKVRGYAILLSIVLCLLCCSLLGVFCCVLFGCFFGYGMDEVMMYTMISIEGMR